MENRPVFRNRHRENRLFVLVFLSAVSTSLFSQTVHNVGTAQPYPTIASAIVVAGDGTGDIINVVDAVHTENNIGVTKSLTIQGQGATKTTVQGHALKYQAASRIFTIASGKTVTIRDMQIQHGYINPGVGGGINVVGTLTLLRVNLIDNYASSHGGGIYNAGTLTVEDCCLLGNETSSTANGGAIYNSVGNSVTLENCTVSENMAKFGGGIANYDVFDINSCTIVNNTMNGGAGGGVYSTSANLTIKNSIVADNIPLLSPSCDVDGLITDNDYNLIETTTGGLPTGGTWASNDVLGIDPILSAIALNNAVTETYTHHIASLSPARDHIPSAGPNGAPAQDQRGASRNGNYDIGAYEYWADDGSLPVGLSSFSGVFQDGEVVLTWTVESEVNNMGFILERKAEGPWLRIASYETHGDLKGRGNASSQKVYTYTDPTAPMVTEISYRLSDMSLDGEQNVLDVMTVSTLADPPDVTDLEPASPNPFNPRTKIVYRLAEETTVSLTVHDLMGRKVRTLLDRQVRPAGSYTVYWDGRNDHHARLPSGMFFVVMRTENFNKVSKVTLIR